MPDIVDTPQPAPVALTGEISFFSCIAAQDATTQGAIWNALGSAFTIYQDSHDTDEARRIFNDYLIDSGISIAPGCTDRLTPEARQLLRESVDAADILNRYAALSDDLQSKMMLSSSLVCSWNEAAAKGDTTAAASYTALHHFSDIAYQIIDGEAPAQIEVAEGYTADEFRQLQTAWNTIQSVEKAYLMRQDTERHERQSESARGIFQSLKEQIDAMPRCERLSVWESALSVVNAEIGKIYGGGSNG